MKIAGWDKWQTFRKDRGTPPWIKVYRNLLSNEQWVCLSDEDKGHLVSIWILAADKNGEIPDNPKMIQRMAMLDTPPNLNKLIELEFLEYDDNHMATTCQPVDNHELNLPPHVDAPEESRVEESRDRVEEIKPPIRPKVDDSEFEMFWGMYERKGNKKTSKLKFSKLSESVKKLIADHIPKYIQSKPEKQFRKDFERYIEKECWNDEITSSVKPSINNIESQNYREGTF